MKTDVAIAFISLVGVLAIVVGTRQRPMYATPLVAPRNHRHP